MYVNSYRIFIYLISIDCDVSLYFSLSRLQDKLQVINIDDNQSGGKVKNCHNENTKAKEKKVLVRLPPGATTAGIFPSPPPPGVLVITPRAPRGPDGTKGFMRR